MKKHILLPVVLDLFDGGAAAGGAAAGAGDGGAGTGSQGEATGAVPGTTRRGKTGEYANVKFGVQPEETPASDAGKQNKTEVSTTSDTLETRKAEFQKFLTDYKDLDDERQQALFNRRFKDYKTLQDSNAKNQPIIDMLMQRFNITDGSPEKLLQALENDDALWEEAAADAGMTVEQYRRFQKLERENARLVKEQEQKQGQEKADAQLRQWYAEAEALKAKYPAFDLNAEVQDQNFKAMLRAGVPMEHAYKVIHMDSIINDAANSAAATAERRVADNVRANGMRPKENGTAAQSGFIVKDDVHKLTKQDRAEAIRRSQMGDRITFTR